VKGSGKRYRETTAASLFPESLCVLMRRRAVPHLLMLHDLRESCCREDFVHTNPWRYDPALKAWIKS
jgi:hypothetical protein